MPTRRRRRPRLRYNPLFTPYAIGSQRGNGRETPQGSGYYTEYFNSWGSYLAHCTKSQTDNLPDPGSTARENSLSWDLGIGWDRAVKFAMEGWPDGTARTQNLSVTLTKQIASNIERYDPYYSLEGGGQLDVARYLEGEPECWIRYEEITTTGLGIKLITLTFVISVSAAIGAGTLLAKGATIAALIECLEYTGHRVKVQLAACYDKDKGHGSRPVQCIVKLKDFNETLDLGRVTFALAHPASLRRINFAWAERLPGGFQRGWSSGGGYGVPLDVEEQYQGDIYIPYSSSLDVQWTNPTSAKQWVIKQLEKQGITLREGDNG